MSETYISVQLRRLIRERAGECCEYCGTAESDTWFGCEVDHILSEKHGGETAAENLALACMPCNRAKGSDIATVDDSGGLIEIFHPRRHLWGDHFARDGALIVGQTAIGRATVRLLRLNSPDRVAERR